MQISRLDARTFPNFSSGNPHLDNWFHKFAFANQRAGMATTYVALLDDELVGFVSISAGAVVHLDASARLTQGVAKHQVPILNISRLAVDERFQRKGVGRVLLSFALRTCLEISESVGVRAIQIMAKDQKAKDFYMSCARFEESPTNPLILVALIKDLKQSNSL